MHWQSRRLARFGQADWRQEHCQRHLQRGRDLLPSLQGWNYAYWKRCRGQIPKPDRRLPREGVFFEASLEKKDFLFFENQIFK
jgi:hypothetical protein